MRTEEERAEFCATIMSAARKLSIPVGYFTNKGKHRYVWNDMLSQVYIEGPICDTKEEALEQSCEVLVSYFNHKPDGQESCKNNHDHGQGGSTRV